MTAAAEPAATVGPRNDLTDVEGLRVGHAHRLRAGWRTGTTVVLTPPGTVGGVDVRGGGPGTRETDALAPWNLVPHVHAVCLTGGSAYGLAAADGVMLWLEEQRIGYQIGDDPERVVPIVPAAVLFDLGRGGNFRHRPDAAFGRAAAAAAGRGRRPRPVVEGTVGAGTGALAGGVAGGIGSASAFLPDGTTVAALVAVNAAGAVFDAASGILHAAPLLHPTADPRLRRPARNDVAAARRALAPPEETLNTTIGVVATDLSLGRAEAHRLAGAAHDGLSRAVRPSHLLTDGDTFFGLATGSRERAAAPSSPDDVRQLNLLFAAAADVVARAIARGVLAARSHADRPAYRDLFPSAAPRGQQ